MAALDDIYVRNADVLPRMVAGEPLLIPIRGRLADMQQIYALNEVADAIWNGLDGSHKLETVLAGIVAEFDVPETDAKADLLAYVEELEKAGLVSCIPAEPSAACN